MKRIAPIALLCLILVGCTPTPNRAQVVERFEIELAAAIPVELGTLAEDLADDAFSGRCGSDAYRTALDDSGLIHVWDATCSMYFEHDMTEAQHDRAREAIVGSVVEQLED